jgi:hypothetical protein
MECPVTGCGSFDNAGFEWAAGSPHLLLCGASPRPVQESSQRMCLRDRQIVTGQDADDRSALAGRLDVAVEQLQAAVLCKRRQDVDARGFREERLELQEKRLVVASSDQWLRPILEVISLPGNDLADTSTRIRNIPLVPWDDVHVEVHHCLSGGSAYVDPDVVSGRTM